MGEIVECLSQIDIGVRWRATFGGSCDVFIVTERAIIEISQGQTRRFAHVYGSAASHFVTYDAGKYHSTWFVGRSSGSKVKIVSSFRHNFRYYVFRRDFELGDMKANPIKIAVVLVLLASLITLASPSSADLAEDIEALKKEQERVREEKSAQAKSVDTATAQAAEVTEALKVLNEQVNAQQAKIDSAEKKSEEVVARSAEAGREAEALEKTIDEQKEELAGVALKGFRERSLGGSVPGLNGEQLGDVMRKDRLAKKATRNELEVAEELKQSKADLEALVREGATAKTEFDKIAKTLDEDKRKLEQARDAQAELAADAEERLEDQLSESAVLEERDKELAESIREKNNPVAKQTEIANRNRQPAPPGAAPSVAGPPSGKIVSITNYAGQKIEVDSSIASNVQAMYDAASAAGIKLGGWGYRSANRQIQLRAQNCGGNSNYAIYQKPSSSCSPPTARPGRSNHERGLAVDITSGGSTIRSRNSTAFRWLNANAGRYGLKNLPSEPWHWSVNGK